MIVVDLHEPDELKQIADEIKDLGFDYLITGSERTYIIERKTLVDLVGSIRSRDSKVKDRLFEQLLRIKNIENEMRAEGKEAYAILVVEGNHFKRYNARFAKMTPQQWMGIQAKVVEMGIGMIRTWTI
ncbi:MAG: ERCC4 domain-containing protein, partial [Candidatus Aenigmatarchaeota archaeon]